MPGPRELSGAAPIFTLPIVTGAQPPRLLVTMRYRVERLTLAQRELLWKMASSPAIPAPTSTSSRAPRQRVLRVAGKLPAPPGDEPDPCCCLACQISDWADAHPDQGPEALKEAFIKSMGGMQVFHESFATALRMEGVGFLAPSFQEVSSRLDDLFECVACHRS